MIADFHIHSKYSRACSRNLTLPNIGRAGERKGIDLVTTGDFTHPAWFADIKNELVETAAGIFSLRDKSAVINFILTTELSCIYTQGGKTRRVHLLVFAPSIAAVEKLIAELEKRKCNLHSDGRPILGLSAKEILQIILEISPEMMLVPAHAWTPWFSVFGSKSGFDSLEECFEELTPAVRAIETGLSSDPLMNWHWSALDDITLISNSDAHSLEKLGREANVFNLTRAELTFQKIRQAINEKNSGGLKETIEFFPEEGKYHADGHADCKFFCTPAETEKLNGLCPHCQKKLTIGVLNRVHVLADRKKISTEVIHKQVPFRSIIPLAEIIAHVLQVGVASKKVSAFYDQLITKVGNEFFILLNAEISLISAHSTHEIAAAIELVRRGEVSLTPGYDGVFGVIKVLRKKSLAQETLL